MDVASLGNARTAHAMHTLHDSCYGRCKHRAGHQTTHNARDALVAPWRKSDDMGALLPITRKARAMRAFLG
ncbi:hypothetical protein BVV10_07420 [Xanthomonas oryzae pv. oryzae]|nr:hypothetical protein BVV10_07420 [Xanthomonas oryzae pv. oryzae]AUJ08432.1 hypothetical protein BVV09_07410 [Xanthomonas oryzae pv. oryzae]QBN38765.1 hypothetical protein EBA04_07055 [Xanthomonas oryzae pv. oryzae]QBN53361.1 hypothetical protein EBA08_07050 [Xanthomonas oryzae pv. oryzae]QBN57016.1 hypothetical protein EBA09_07070 [Xanthomonas oryzae pv. oryzae]